MSSFRRRIRTLSELIAVNMTRPDPCPAPPVNVLKNMLEQPS